jgi:hypothetical protein
MRVVVFLRCELGAVWVNAAPLFIRALTAAFAHGVLWAAGFGMLGS